MITRLCSMQGGALDFDTSVPCFVTRYTDYMMSNDFRELNLFSVTQLDKKATEHRHLTWIVDMKMAEVFNDDDVKWADNKFNPELYARGIRFMAIVVPSDVMANMNMDDYVRANNQSQNPFVMKLCADIESARQWCREVLMMNLE
jgi:hypothetical protein